MYRRWYSIITFTLIAVGLVYFVPKPALALSPALSQCENQKGLINFGAMWEGFKSTGPVGAAVTATSLPWLEEGAAVTCPNCPHDVLHVEYAPCIGAPTGASKLTGGKGLDCVGVRSGKQTANLRAGECSLLHLSKFCAEKRGDLLCGKVSGLGGLGGYIDIGCQYLPEPPRPGQPCIAQIAPSCRGQAGYSASVLPIPMTSMVVQCIEDTIKQMFFNQKFPGACAAHNPPQAMFANVRGFLERAVYAVITLFFVIWGLNIVLMKEIPKKGEIFMNFIKVILVMYFVLGDGWEEYLPALLGATNSISEIILRAASDPNFCYFDRSLYPPGKGNLALWDMLDCKILTYMGFSGEIDIKEAPKVLVFAFASLIKYPLTGIIILIFSILFALALILMTIFIAHIYILAFFALSLILFVSPIFIPMVLFKYTKRMFDSWLSELISYSIYPIILFAFLALVMSTFDIILFKEASFTMPTVGSGNHRCGAETALLSQPQCGTEDLKAFGCILHESLFDTYTFLADVFSFTTLKQQEKSLGSIWDITLALLKAVLFGFLFFQFLQILTGLAAELSGSARTDIGKLSVRPAEKLAGLAAAKMKDKYSESKKAGADKRANKKGKDGGGGDA